MPAKDHDIPLAFVRECLRHFKTWLDLFDHRQTGFVGLIALVAAIIT